MLYKYTVYFCRNLIPNNYSVKFCDWSFYVFLLIYSNYNSTHVQVFIYKDNDNNNIFPVNRTYVADIRTEPMDSDYDLDPENFPHTYSAPFNPYRESKEESLHARTHAYTHCCAKVNPAPLRKTQALLKALRQLGGALKTCPLLCID